MINQLQRELIAIGNSKQSICWDCRNEIARESGGCCETCSNKWDSMNYD